MIDLASILILKHYIKYPKNIKITNSSHKKEEILMKLETEENESREDFWERRNFMKNGQFQHQMYFLLHQMYFLLSQNPLSYTNECPVYVQETAKLYSRRGIKGI